MKALVVAMLCAVVCPVAVAKAQSISPARAVVDAVSNVAAIRVRVRNPYSRTMQMRVEAFDRRFAPIGFRADRKVVTIPAGQSAPVLVMVPFEDATSRRVRVCVSTMAVGRKRGRAGIRARACGRYWLRRL